MVLARAFVVVMLVASCRFDLPAVPEVDAGMDADSMAWLHPWTHRKQITLRASQIEAVGDRALVDFPVLVSVTDPQIGAAALATGADIAFTAADGSTVLASELEAFTPASGQLVAWVKVPRLPATTDTTLYVYYGNPTPPAGSPEEVWTPGYLGVWHLHQDPARGGVGDIRDATAGDHDGTAVLMEAADSVPGQIGRGLAFNGVDEFLDFGALNVGNTFTISMWIQFAGGNSVRTLMTNSALGGDTDGFRFFINTAGPTAADRRLVFETGNGQPGSVRRALTGANAIPLNAFVHVAAVVNRATSVARLYVNGARVDTATSIRNDFRIFSDFEVAQMKGGFLLFTGKLDEIQVSKIEHSSEWIRTSFKNQSRPGTFHTLGPEELRPERS